MKRADFRNLRGNVTFINCTIEIKETSNSSIDKLKTVIIIAYVFALILIALVVSQIYPELLPDFIRLAISVATRN